MTKFSIQLERPSGIFYAGEVVRGTVKLSTAASAVTCRAFNIQLKGEARVHWHTGSGDNRTDYDGHTLYQDQRLTVRGNFYKTGLLDEAGEDADFDLIHNLGVLQIPCSSLETERLSMIVRVMDYDWGKKDDLLGEILLDVPALARLGAPQSFPLTRKGKPEKGQVTISAKYLPYSALFPMSTPSGIAVSRDISQEYCLVLQIHQAMGLRKADWVGKNDVNLQAYRIEDAKSSEIVPGRKLPGPLKKLTIPADTQIIAPFAFSLRHDAPPSAELGIRDRSHIRYKIRAYLDLANWRDPFSNIQITVIPNRPIPKLLLIQPYMEQPGPQPLYSCCCSTSKSGMATIKIVTDRIAYAAGESIDLSQTTILYEGKEKEVFAEVVLMGYYRLKSFHSHTEGHREYILGQITLTPDVNMKLDGITNTSKFPIPPVYPSFYGGVKDAVHQRTHYCCLQWTYSIGIKIGGKGCSTHALAALPLLISSAPPYKEILKDYQELPPQRATNIGIWNIFEYAVLGPEQGCTTAPTITGPEDGGTTVPVGNPINTWEGTDGNYYVGDGEGQGSMNYQPMITTFDGPMGLYQEQQEPESSNIPMVPAELMSDAGASTASLVDRLLQSMDNELDKRLVVGKWIRDHPVEAQHLSPDDFHSILSKVTFSLEQSSVVGELVAAFEDRSNGRLTCQHIVSTMNVCQYQKTEVATLMAPYVNDPQNKNLVLDNLDYSFDKSRVSGNFSS